MKRFYQDVSVSALDEGYAIDLDGRTVKTPAKNILLAPKYAIAQVVKQEWQAQEDKIDPARMPITRILNTKIDRVSARRDAVIDELAAFGPTDLLCYRAPYPDGLVALQKKHWDPVLDWMRTAYGIALRTTSQVRPICQDDKALAALQTSIAAHDDDRLCALHMTTNIAGSVALGLAFVNGALSRDALWAAAMVEETYQAEQWGLDKDAEKRQATLTLELDDIATWLRLLDAQEEPIAGKRG